MASSRGPVRSETCNAGRAYPACNTFYTRCRKAIILEDTWDEVLGYLRKKHHDRTKPSHSKVIKQQNHKKPVSYNHLTLPKNHTNTTPGQL